MCDRYMFVISTLIDDAKLLDFSPFSYDQWHHWRQYIGDTGYFDWYFSRSSHKNQTLWMDVSVVWSGFYHLTTDLIFDFTIWSCGVYFPIWRFVCLYRGRIIDGTFSWYSHTYSRQKNSYRHYCADVVLSQTRSFQISFVVYDFAWYRLISH